LADPPPLQNLDRPVWLDGAASSVIAALCALGLQGRDRVDHRGHYVVSEAERVRLWHLILAGRKD